MQHNTNNNNNSNSNSNIINNANQQQNELLNNFVIPNPVAWTNSNGNNNNNNNNNTNTNMQQQQQQQRLQQHRIINWLPENNKHQQQQQQHLNNNNNNNNSNNNNNNNNNNNTNINYNQHLMHQQQQQQQQHYMRQQQQQQQQQQHHYSNYQQQQQTQQQLPTISCYYAQQQQQRQQQQVLAPPTTYATQQQHIQQLGPPPALQRQQQPHVAVAQTQMLPTHLLQQHQQQQLQHQQQHRRLVSLDGIQSGVPTLTTPTLTPTTLRSIEESFLQLTSDTTNAPYQAGFKPPPLAPLISANVNGNNNNNSSNNNNNSNTPTTITGALGIVGIGGGVGGGGTTNAAITNLSNYGTLDYNSNVEASDSEYSQLSWNDGAQSNGDNTTTDASSAATDSSTYPNGFNNTMGSSTSNGGGANDFSAVIAAAKAAASIAKNSSLIANSTTSNHMINSNTSNSATTGGTTPARRGGGRRPAKSTNMSPEEEEKRRIRRERNKLAAARCRKRRVDQTNELLEEVAILEKKRETMQKVIESLTVEKTQLEYVLETHRPTCQRVRDDILSVATSAAAAAAAYNGLIAVPPTNNNTNSNDSTSNAITGHQDPSLNSTGRSNSPLDLKPVLIDDNVLQQIKHEPMDNALDSCSSLDHDGPPSPKRRILSSLRNHAPMVTPLPNIATLTASLTTPTGPSGSLQTPIVSMAPVSFGAYAAAASNNNVNAAIGGINPTSAIIPTTNAVVAHALKSMKPRPTSLPTVPRTFGQNLQLNVVDGKAPTEIQGVPIQTPSTGMFNFDSLMDGGTGLTPVSGPLVPTCSSQNKHPLELPTPTSEPSKLVSL